MSSRRLILVGALLLWCVSPAAAQSIKLEFHDGRVTLSAQNAPVRSILAEWSRIGGTRIVNGDRVGGVPVTLELDNVPERTALDVLLRSVSGYMAGPRASAVNGLSSFDSLLIVPTSVAAPAPAPARPAGLGLPIPQPIVPQIDPNDPEENPPGDVAPGQQPRRNPNLPPNFRRPPFPDPNRPGGIVTGPGVVQPVQPEPDDQPEPEDRPATTTPSNPFGVAPGSSRPGEITPVPKQQPPPAPRPNGDPEP